MTEDVEQILAGVSVATELFGQGITTTSLYLTALSGYLLVAYFIGRDLGRLQAAIVTGIFVFFAGTLSLGAIVLAILESGRSLSTGLTGSTRPRVCENYFDLCGELLRFVFSDVQGAREGSHSFFSVAF